MDWIGFGASALEGGLNVLSQVLTNNENSKLQRETNELNYQMFQEQQDFLKSESELAFQREKEMWNMQNEYNSPAQQMKRYQEAGLNPNLIYGQGTPGNAQSAPSYSPAQSASRPEMKASKNQAPNINVLSQYAQLSQLKENTELINMQKQVYEQDVEAKRIQNKYAESKEQLSLDMTAIQMAKEKGIINETEARIEYQRIQNKFAEKNFELDIEQKIANLDLSKLQHKIQSSQSVLDNNIKREMIEKVKAETQHIKNQSELINAQAQSLIDKLGAERIRNRIMEQTGVDVSSGNLLSALTGLAGKLGLTFTDFINEFF